MHGFKDILVPVDFSANTETAVQKGIEIATAMMTRIHLLHIGGNESAGVNDTSLSIALDKIKNQIKGCPVETHIVSQKKVEPAIITFATLHRPDIIVIGKTNHHCLFPYRNTVISSNIVEETGCPVLTVSSGSLQRKIKTIVMPVSECFPAKKIDVLETLSKNISLDVHLLSVLSNNQAPDNFTNSAVLQIMRSVRNRLQCRIQHTIIHSQNKAIATLGYADEVNADILLVSPEAESSITTWMLKKDTPYTNIPAAHLQLLSVQAN